MCKQQNNELLIILYLVIWSLPFKRCAKQIKKNVNVQRGLRRKYKSKKQQTEESASKQNLSTMSNADVLPVNNKFSILSDLTMRTLWILTMRNLMGNKLIKFKITVTKKMISEQISKLKICINKYCRWWQ